jgi:Xaa-Pro aminopeptidase
MLNIFDIQQFLSDKKIDFLVIKNTNQFFSEYLPQKQQFIKHITGFTGSNATVIFGKEKNYFFTDGRYLLQAQYQISGSMFVIIDITSTSIKTWLDKNVKATQKIAFIDSLINVYEWQQYNELSQNIVLINSLDLDPFQNFWSDQNESSAFVCSDETCGLSSLNKRQQITSANPQKTFLLTNPENICWLLNLRGRDLLHTPIFFSLAILHPNNKITLFANLENIQHLNLAKNFIELFSLNQVENFFATFHLHKNQIYTDFTTTNCYLYNILLNNNFTVYTQKCPITQQKTVKNLREITGAYQSARLDSIALVKFFYWLQHNHKTKQSITEAKAQQHLEFLHRQSVDFFYESFNTISAYESNGAIIHYQCTPDSNLILNSGSLFLIDSGAQYLGNDFYGTTDITRTIALGKPSTEMILHYTLVLKGHLAIARAKFPKGTKGYQLDSLARQYLWQFGLDYAHSTGHGVGSFLGVHEDGCGIGKNNQNVLLPNMILSNEPGVYLVHKYGIRLENLILVKEYNDDFLCFETISLAPFDYNLIDTKMLTYPEKKWLQNYHQTIWQQTSQHLTEAEKKFLLDCVNKFSFDLTAI